MKKIFSLLLTLILILSLIGCEKREYELPKGDFCFSSDYKRVIELSSEEKNYIIDLLNNGEWSEGIVRCDYDAKLETQQQYLGYNVSKGIFNDFTQKKSLQLAEEERGIVNEYLGKPVSKLIEIKEYSSLTKDGTSSIDVLYAYNNETYDFVIKDPEVIENIMTKLYDMRLKPYPENVDFFFSLKSITVHQGVSAHMINLSYTSDTFGNEYLCQSQGVCEIIEKYIEDNLS